MNDMWKKIVVLGVAAAFMVLLTGEASFAGPAARTGDVIGVIDSQMIVTKHPKFEETARQLQQVMRQKENEARTAVDSEPDQAKKAQIMQTKRMEAAREEQRLMEPIYKDCQEAVRVIARQRNVTIVLEKASVYFGGEDITDYVVQQLSRGK
ncbi:MAG: OmpH family outer membrane protein [Synergistaceae bacterium]|nr:OmpH family outer membrane protein [Synergistaceae bacterium]